MKLSVFILIGIISLILIVPSFGQNQEKLRPVVVGSLVGYQDENGKIVIEPQFDAAKKFSEGLAAVKAGKKFGGDWEGRWGYIDEKGDWAIKPNFTGAGSFSEGLAPARELKKELLRTECLGTAIIQHYRWISGKWGYIDKKGKWKIKPKYDRASMFSNGKAIVEGDSSFMNQSYNSLSKAYFYIDGKGNEIKLYFHDYEAIRFSFLEDMTIEDIRNKSQPAGLLGEHNTPPKYFDPNTGMLSEGLQAVKIDEKWGYQDTKRKVVINPQFDGAAPFFEGLAAVNINGKWGYIDKSGKIIINHQFDGAAPFFEGLAAVKIGEKWGYIDKSGKIIINPQFDATKLFIEGLAAIEIDKKWGFVDKNGKIISQPQFDDVADFSEGLAQVRIDKKWGYIDKSGKIIINPQFDDVADFSEGLAAVKIEGKWGYIDKNGTIIINPQFSLAGCFSGGKAWANMLDKDGYVIEGYIDKEGVFTPDS